MGSSKMFNPDRSSGSLTDTGKSRRKPGRRSDAVREAARRYWADLAEEDLADEIEPVTDEWAADYEGELDRRNTMAAEGHALAEAEPGLFRRYWEEFVLSRFSGRKSDLMIAERKGHDGSWKTRTVAHKGKVRFRVERHLDPSRYWHRTAWLKPEIRPSFAYWLACPMVRRPPTSPSTSTTMAPRSPRSAGASPASIRSGRGPMCARRTLRSSTCRTCPSRCSRRRSLSMPPSAPRPGGA